MNLIKDRGFMDVEVADDLCETIDTEGLDLEAPVPGYVISEGRENDLSLLTKGINSEIKYELKQKNYRWIWQDLMERYGITRLLGKVGMYEERGWKDDRIFELSTDELIGEIREDQLIFSVARRYGMTNLEFMRFRLLVKAAHKAWRPVVYEDVAKEILEA